MAASVSAATSVGAAGALGEHLDDLALHQGRVDVHHDEPLGPAVQPGPLDRHVDAEGRGGERELGAQLGIGSTPDTSSWTAVTG